MRPDKNDYLPMFGTPIADWHKKFALLPTCTVDHGLVWLRFVWRRRIIAHDYVYNLKPDYWWQYAYRPAHSDEDGETK